MQVIEGWAIFNSHDWCVDYDDIYPTKEEALEAAKSHFCYRYTDEWFGDEVIKVTIKVH